MTRHLTAALVLGACLAGPAAAGQPPAGMALVPEGDYAPLFRAKDDPATVRVPAFYIDVRQVTNADFLGFVRANPNWRRSQVSPLFAESGYLGDWSGDLELGPRAPSDSPVVLVSWFAARAYARWRGLRLPSTAEWERAASAGFTSANGAADPAYREAILAWLSVPTPPVLPAAGSGRPDVYGVRDLTDLVWEWVDDFNAMMPGGDSADNSGLDRDLVCGAGGANARDFTDYPAFMRVAFRSSLGAAYVVPNLGFRCAKSL
jgi:formylglycine-generating enzyme required for sulfatase activity